MSDERDFGSILEEFERGSGGETRDDELEPGDRVSGEIISIGEEAVFVDVGAKSDAIVARTELSDEEGELEVTVGDTVEGLVTGHDEASGCFVLRVRPGAAGLGAGDSEIAIEEISQAQAHGIPIEGTVSAAIKGGVEVRVSGMRAFCPVSQLDTAFVEDPEEYVGRRLTFLVRKFERGGRGRGADIVLSRRDLLEEEERKRREEALARLEAGVRVQGTVASVVSYGAFIDLSGIQGLLHVSEMAYERIEDPTELFSEGDVVEVEVLSVEEREGGDPRISLSRKGLLEDPWEEVQERFPEGEIVSGRVMRIEPFGAFVRIAPGLDGLVHVSELATDRRVGHPREVVELGQDVEVKVLGVDVPRHRISLSLATAGKGADAETVEEMAKRDTSAGFGSMAKAFENIEED